MKYIVLKELTGREYPILFPETIKHSLFQQRDPRYTSIVSAGFCHKEQLSGRWVTQGESLTLRIKPRPEDAELISKVYK